MEDLESREAELSAVVAEKEKLTRDIQQQKANEEGLHCLLQEKDKTNSELLQANERQRQRLREVVAVATVSDLWLVIPTYSLHAVCRLYM